MFLQTLLLCIFLNWFNESSSPLVFLGRILKKKKKTHSTLHFSINPSKQVKKSTHWGDSYPSKLVTNKGDWPIHPHAQLVTFSPYNRIQVCPLWTESFMQLVLIYDYPNCWACIFLLISFCWTYEHLLSLDSYYFSSFQFEVALIHYYLPLDASSIVVLLLLDVDCYTSSSLLKACYFTKLLLLDSHNCFSYKNYFLSFLSHQ